MLVNHLQLLMQWRFNILAFKKYQVNQLLKVQLSNLLMMQEKISAIIGGGLEEDKYI